MKKWGYGFLCLLLVSNYLSGGMVATTPVRCASRKRCRQMDSLLQRSQRQYIGKIS